MADSVWELPVWQRAMPLSLMIYRLTRDLPREELYGLTTQVRRSSVSIASKIAEGQGRMSVGEFKQFLGITRGSNLEVQTQLELARFLEFGDLILI